MTTSAGTRLSPPPFIFSEQEHRRQLGAWAREAHQGHLANVGSVTLSTATAATAVVDSRVGPNSFIGLMPTTANAAQELGAGSLYISARSAEGFTIAHANTSTADRAYVYCILG